MMIMQGLIVLLQHGNRARFLIGVVLRIWIEMEW